MKWLKHAFAIDPPGPAEPTPEQKPAVDHVCAEVVRRELATPALLFLESSRPLNYLGAQALHFFAPVVSVLTSSGGPAFFAAFLEKRGAVDYLCRTIEDFEEEAIRRVKEAKKTPPDPTSRSLAPQTDPIAKTDPVGKIDPVGKTVPTTAADGQADSHVDPMTPHDDSA